MLEDEAFGVSGRGVVERESGKGEEDRKGSYERKELARIKGREW